MWCSEATAGRRGTISIMGRTYEAILTGRQLDWTAEKPEVDQPVRVRVTVVEPASAGGDNGLPPDAVLHAPNLSKQERGRRMRGALEQLAAIDAFADVPDPVQWQREVRRDRPLPGRDE
jgi:hypothetical protein